MAEQVEDLTANDESLPPNDELQLATSSINSEPKPLSETSAENTQTAPSVSAIIQPTSTEPNTGEDAEAADSKPADKSRPAAECTSATDSVGESQEAANPQTSAASEPASLTRSATKVEAGDSDPNHSATIEAHDYDTRIAQLEDQIKELQQHPARLYSRLEARVRSIEKPIKKTATSSTTAKDKSINDKRDYTQFCRALPRINFMTIDEWDRRKVSLNKPHAALDVVVSSKVKTDRSKDQLLDQWDGSDLKFIQLSSIPALYAWSKIVHGTLDPEKNLSKPMVILAPFKNLTDFAEEISRAYEKLEPKWNARASNDPETKIELRWLSDDTDMNDNANVKHDHGAAAEASERTNTEASRTEEGTKSSDEPSLNERREESVLPVSVDTTVDAVDGTASKLETLGSASTRRDGSAITEIESGALVTESAAADGGGFIETTPEGPTTELADRSLLQEENLNPQDTAAPAETQKPGNEKYSQDALNEESYDAYLGLRTLLRFYEVCVEPRWKRLRSKSLEEVGEVEFSDLCELFQPGDDVYAADEPQPVWRVIRVTGGRPKLVHFLDPSSKTAEESGADINSGVWQVEDTEASKWTPLYIIGYYLDYDGSNFGPSRVSHKVEYYSGAKRIDKLKCWPLRFADEQSRSNYTKNGRLFFEKCQPGLHRYEGRTLNRSPRGSLLPSVGPSALFSVTSQVYVDFTKAFQFHPKWGPSFQLDHAKVMADPSEISLELSDFKDRGSAANLRRWAGEGVDSVFRFQTIQFPERNASIRFLKKDRWINEDEGIKTSDRNRIEPHDQILLPNRLFGYVLQSREWACFNIDPKCLKESARDDTAWNELQLPKDHKRSLQALIEFHFENKRATEGQAVGGVDFDFDFINGKGQGLVVLLHGPPGLGKTTTAESIARKYHKPLLPITCGTISIDPQTVEKSLIGDFHLAQDWDAIILLDEADVFVAQRTGQDLKINAIVSVFLRALEYYTGVLFLTTNRVGQFDEALLSRVNLNLLYPEFELESTIKIWDNNLTRVLKQQKITQGTGPGIIDWVGKQFEWNKQNNRPVLNGRQIRIAFQRAVALAHLDAKESRAKGDSDAKPVLKVENFEAVMNDFNNFDDYMRATRGVSYKDSLDRGGLRSATWTPIRAFDPPASSTTPNNDAAASRENPPADYANSPHGNAPFNPQIASPQTPSKSKRRNRGHKNQNSGQQS